MIFLVEATSDMKIRTYGTGTIPSRQTYPWEIIPTQVGMAGVKTPMPASMQVFAIVTVRAMEVMTVFMVTLAMVTDGEVREVIRIR